MGSTFAIKAFVCALDAEESRGIVKYRPAVSDEEILAAPSASLLFTDKPELSEDDIQTLFETKFPTRTVGLSRVEVKREYGYKVVDGRNKYVDEIGYITICQEHDAVCRTRSEETVAQVATRLGFVKVLPDNHFYPAKLAEFGCYKRYSNARQQFEVVYDPKIVERRKRKEQERSTRRTTKYLSVWEIQQISKQAYDRLQEVIEVSAWYEHHWTRYSAINNVTKWITLFGLVFGPSAHRQLPAFQDVLEAWREPGVRESTISAWANSWTDNFHRDQLWRWLDAEVKVKKPRKRKLRLSRNLCKVPLMPTAVSGITSNVFKDVYRTIGEKVRVWIDNRAYPFYGIMREVTPEGVRVGDHWHGWQHITKIVSYEGTWHRQCYVKVEEKIETVDPTG